MYEHRKRMHEYGEKYWRGDRRQGQKLQRGTKKKKRPNKSKYITDNILFHLMRNAFSTILVQFFVQKPAEFIQFNNIFF
jgi:hypothetical protein